MKSFKIILTACLSLLPILGLLFTQGAAHPVAASAGEGVIAYVRQNDTTGDEIHLINPDGSNDHMIWRTGVEGVTTSPDVSQLAWKPGSTELAFWSRFQEACSFYSGDIYGIHPDGSGLRRITAPPVCGGDQGLPTGTVDVPVANETGELMTFVVYIQGAPKPQEVTLADGDIQTLTFTDVIDFGDNVIQWAVAVYGEDRYTAQSAHADIIPGKTVTTNGPLYLYSPTKHWGWGSPAYNGDGSQMAYIFGSGTIYDRSTNGNDPGGVGDYLLKTSDLMPGDPERLQWGSGAHAHQLLYSGYDWDTGDGWSGDAIYLVNEGDTTVGTPVVITDPDHTGATSLGLAWLPDGSGFVYSLTQVQYDPTYARFGNIWVYKFDTKQSTQVTHFTSGYPRELSVSPDGKTVVYEFQATGDWSDTTISVDLYTMNIDGSNQKMLVTNAYSPAWSPSDLPVTYRLELPFMVK